MLGGAGEVAFMSGGAMQMMAREEANLMSHSMAMRNVAPPHAPGMMPRSSNRQKKKRAMNFGAAPNVSKLAGNMRPEYEELEEVKEYAETHFYGVKYQSEMGTRTAHS